MAAACHASARSGGFTLLEATIASVLFFAVILVTYSTAVTVMQYQATNDAEFAAETAYRRVLDFLERELRDTSMERDPITDTPRYWIETDAEGRQRLRFRKLIGAGVVNSEVRAVWSSDIVISYDDNGQVYRTQDGRSIPIGSGVDELRFETTTSKKLRVTCITRWRDPRSGRVVKLPHQILIKPLN